MSLSKMMTLDQAAGWTEVSVKTFRRWIAKGYLDAVRSDGTVYVHIDQVREIRTAHRHAPSGRIRHDWKKHVPVAP